MKKQILKWLLIGACVITVFTAFDREASKHHVSEAFFRHIFKNNQSGKQQNAKAYFLEIEKKDPSRKLLAEFKNHSPPVKKGSEFKRISGGILFRIDSYKWYGNIVVIDGGYYEGYLSASWHTSVWIQIAGVWILMFRLPGPIA